MQSALLLALVVTLASAQSVVYYNASADAAALESKFATYSADIRKLQQQVTKIHTNLQKANTTTAGIAALEEGMAEERDILFNIESYLEIPFNTSVCECYNWTEFRRNELKKQLNNVKLTIAALEADLEGQPECARTTALRNQLRREKLYMNSIENIINSNCCKVKETTTATPERNATGLINLSESTLQTNLQASRWCYGNLTWDQIKLDYFKRATNKNITNCPLATPFFDGKSCINCTENSPYFDMSSLKCVNTAKWNSTTRQCDGTAAAGGSTITGNNTNATTSGNKTQTNGSNLFDENDTFYEIDNTDAVDEDEEEQNNATSTNTTGKANNTTNATTVTNTTTFVEVEDVVSPIEGEGTIITTTMTEQQVTVDPLVGDHSQIIAPLVGQTKVIQTNKETETVQPIIGKTKTKKTTTTQNEQTVAPIVDGRAGSKQTVTSEEIVTPIVGDLKTTNTQSTTEQEVVSPIVGELKTSTTKTTKSNKKKTSETA